AARSELPGVCYSCFLLSLLLYPADGGRHSVSFHFIIQCCGGLPYLHSFPTRRSSDLVMFQMRPAAGSVGDDCVEVFRWELIDIRSEEHTSELQSHLNLVCRLLLEKKKQIKVQNRFRTM